ncbi:MAG: FAD:protein FMN transferase [Candidatus Limiplasma sp.]|nr:FAD:protein FMN transferase [Candidatus Limiplasma sp.]
MGKRILCLAVCLSLCLCTACGETAQGGQGPLGRYSMFFFDTFDTMITIIGYAPDQAVFDRVTAEAKAEFERYHKLYDAYHEYEGVQNIYTLNRDAAKAPVAIGPELWDLLHFATQWQSRLMGSTNIAMGAVLSQWHDAREAVEAGGEAALPDRAALEAAAEHCNLDDVVFDEANRTVFFEDPLLKLDVGAVAKGYATERVAQRMLASEMTSFIINAGGNVRAGNAPAAGRLHWGVGLQDPETAQDPAGQQSMDVLYLENLSVVTSGDYERFFTLDGVRYHHIISPETLMPATQFHAVTVVCQDSGLADILSTALFVLPYEQARELTESLEGVEALWVRGEGENRQVLMTEGMKAYSKNQGATNPDQ